MVVHYIFQRIRKSSFVRLFEARLRAEFTIFPLKNISIHLFTIGPDFLSKEIRGPATGVNRYKSLKLTPLGE